jgi:hypothetical protein
MDSAYSAAQRDQDAPGIPSGCQGHPCRIGVPRQVSGHVKGWLLCPGNFSGSGYRQRGMTRRRLQLLVSFATVLLLASGCSSGVDTSSVSPPESSTTTMSCRYFTLSVGTDRDGESSLLLAAEWFAGHNGLAGWHFPATGWTVVSTLPGAVSVASGTVTLSVARLSDGTWGVEGGKQCP